MPTEQELSALFQSGFAVNGRHFAPAAYFCLASEPDYGCEERSETEPLFGELCGFTAAGPFRLPIEEHALWASGFDDGQWLGRLEGEGLVLLTQRRGKPDRCFAAPRGPWLRPFVPEE